MHRINRLFSKLPETIDTLLIKNSGEPLVDENFFYLTGLTQGLFEGSYIVIHRDTKQTLITSTLEAESAKNAAADLLIYQNGEELHTHLKNTLSASKTIGINFQRISYHEYKKLSKTYPNKTFVDISNHLAHTRMIKDPDELAIIKQAIHITDTVQTKIPEIYQEGFTESDLAAEINYHLQKNGADHPAFTTIASAGSHSAEPHYTHGNTQILTQDFVVCDFGATHKKYNADLTRTFIRGSPTSTQTKIFETVLNAQQQAFDAIQPGVAASDIHTIVEEAINKTEFKGRFIHSTGHQLGLLVHDGPGFTASNSIELKENMVLTVEPGIYIPGLGGVRIEDDIRITRSGVELLSKTPRELFSI